MMNNYDKNFEKKKADFEKGIISVYDFTDEEIKKLEEMYKNEIVSNKKEIEETKYKIKQLKNKIDNIV